MDPVHGQLYIVYRQLIWLGNENGYLVLFKPMDHSFLSQLSYPFTRISLWWKGKPVASSDGEDGLVAAGAAFAAQGNDASLSRLLWSSSDSDNAPLLFIESTSPPLLTVGEIGGPLALSLFAFMLAVWATLGALGIRPLKRLLFARQAVDTQAPGPDQ
jgi:hypothetical protein